MDTTYLKGWAVVICSDHFKRAELYYNGKVIATGSPPPVGFQNVFGI